MKLKNSILRQKRPRESSYREKHKLERKYVFREKDLKDQLAANEIKYQTEINRWEEEKEGCKKDYECKLSTI